MYVYDLSVCVYTHMQKSVCLCMWTLIQIAKEPLMPLTSRRQCVLFFLMGASMFFPTRGSLEEGLHDVHSDPSDVGERH